jgi:hypothetical protein
MIKQNASQFSAEHSAARPSVATSAPVQSSPAFSFPQQSSGPTLPVSLNESMMERADSRNTFDVNISTNHLGPEVRLPCVCICILDVSDSMGLEASPLNPSSGERDGLTRMDLVIKHATKAVINILGDNDHIAIVSFNHAARLVLDLTNTNQLQSVALQTLTPDGRTNIWDGLREALAIAGKPGCAGKNVHVLLLTEGDPNENPPRGIVHTLQSFLNALPLSVTYLRVRYEMNRSLLSDISKTGNGMYAYIPDASLDGTVFSNFISDALYTAVPTLEFAGVFADCELSQFHNLAIAPQGDFPVTKILLRNLHFGQSKDVIMTFTIKNSNATIIVNVTAGDGSSKQLHLNSWGNVEIVTFQQQKAQNLFISKISQALVLSTGGIADSQAIVGDLLAELPAADVHPSISALRCNIVSDAAPGLQEGEVPKAFSRADWLQKWGLHYLKSLVRAHALQECSNFKDPGVQVHGGAMFKQLKEAADTLFVSMPAPVPSSTRNQLPNYSLPFSSFASSSHSAPTPFPAALVQMDRYMDRYGGCLHPNGRVLLRDGT